MPWIGLQFRGAAQHPGGLRHLRSQRHEGTAPGPTDAAQDAQGQYVSVVTHGC